MIGKKKMVKEKIASIFLIAVTILGMGKWTEDKLLVPSEGGAWIVIKTTFVSFYKEFLLVLVTASLFYFILHYWRGVKIKRELRRLVYGKGTPMDILLITIFSSTAIAFLIWKFDEARADFNKLRTGQNLYYSLVTQEIANEAEAKLDEGNLPESIRLYRVVGRLDGGRQMQIASEQLAEVPALIRSISNSIEEGRYCSETLRIIRSTHDHAPFFKDPLLVAAKHKLNAYLKFLDELKHSLSSRTWRDCQTILTNGTKNGFEIGAQASLINEIYDRITFPKNWDFPDKQGLAEGVLQALEEKSGSYFRHADILFIARFGSDDDLKFLDAFRKGVYDPKGLPVVYVDSSDELVSDESEVGDDEHQHDTTTLAQNWWRYASPSGFYAFFKDPKQVNRMIPESSTQDLTDETGEEDGHENTATEIVVEDGTESDRAESLTTDSSKNLDGAGTGTASIRLRSTSVAPPSKPTPKRIFQAEDTNESAPNTTKMAYRVMETDSMDIIAEKFNTTSRELRIMNGMGTFDRLTAGQFLIVPVSQK